MKIELDGGGKVVFAAPQMQWRDSPGDGAIMQVCRMAGHDMMAITDDAGAFDLHYMHHTTGGFRSMDDAKSAAPEFAKQVLNHLLTMIP